jgi:hypothetical protein
MKYGYKILAIVVLIIVAPMIVWTGCGQQQRTPRPADTALQTSLVNLLEVKDYSPDSYFFLPDEDRQQRREVSFECFLLLSLSLLVLATLLLYRYSRRTKLNHLIGENETFLIKPLYSHVIVLR